MNKYYKYIKNVLLEFIIVFGVWSFLSLQLTNGFLYIYGPDSNKPPVVNVKVLQKYETITEGRHSHTKFILVLEKSDKTIVDTVVDPSTFYRARVGSELSMYDNFDSSPIKIIHISGKDFLLFLGFVFLLLLVIAVWVLLVFSILYLVGKTHEFVKYDNEYHNVHYCEL